MTRLSQYERATRTILPLRAAIYHAAHSAKGGVGAIAGAYGFNLNTLHHKLNLNNEGRHVLTVPELEAILGYTRDGRIMDSLCSIYGNAVWIDVSGMDQVNDATMLGQLAEVSTDVGTLARTVAQALADGQVSRDELALLEKSTMKLVQSAQAVLALARTLEEQGHA